MGTLTTVAVVMVVGGLAVMVIALVGFALQRAKQKGHQD